VQRCFGRDPAPSPRSIDKPGALFERIKPRLGAVLKTQLVAAEPVNVVAQADAVLFQIFDIVANAGDIAGDGAEMFENEVSACPKQ
jgi:hypothetical protein